MEAALEELEELEEMYRATWTGENRETERGN